MKKLLIISSVGMIVLATTAIAETRHDWTGITIGVFAGYGLGHRSEIIALGADHRVDHLAGVSFGLSGGLTYQVPTTPLVFGIEGDLNLGKQSRQAIATYPSALVLNNSIDTKILGSVRGRIGFAFDRFLAYGTGGLAWAKSEWSSSVNPPAPFVGWQIADINRERGWVAGGGVEYAIDQNWSAKMEYLYYKFNTQRMFFILETDFPINIHVLRAGINYRF